MIETIILAVTNIALIAFLYFSEHNNRKERRQLINRIIAKDSNEVISLDVADNLPKKEKPVVSDLMPIDSLSDSDFDKMIKQQINK